MPVCTFNKHIFSLCDLVCHTIRTLSFAERYPFNKGRLLFFWFRSCANGKNVTGSGPGARPISGLVCELEFTDNEDHQPFEQLGWIMGRVGTHFALAQTIQRVVHAGFFILGPLRTPVLQRYTLSPAETRPLISKQQRASGDCQHALKRHIKPEFLVSRTTERGLCGGRCKCFTRRGTRA